MLQALLPLSWEQNAEKPSTNVAQSSSLSESRYPPFTGALATRESITINAVCISMKTHARSRITWYSAQADKSEHSLFFWQQKEQIRREGNLVAAEQLLYDLIPRSVCLKTPAILR